MRACMGLLRLWVGALMRAVVRGGLNEANKVHLVLDEAASLGHGMNALNDAVDKYRAYGIRCQFYYQSMGQLKLCWPEDQGQTLLSNSSQVFFAVNDLPTAEYVSNRLGTATIIVGSGGSNTGQLQLDPVRWVRGRLLELRHVLGPQRQLVADRPQALDPGRVHESRPAHGHHVRAGRPAGGHALVEIFRGERAHAPS